MLPKLILLDPDPRGVDSSKYCHLVTQRWTQVGPLCPQEVLKRLGRTSGLVAQRRERVSPPCQGLWAATQSAFAL